MDKKTNSASQISREIINETLLEKNFDFFAVIQLLEQPTNLHRWELPECTPDNPAYVLDLYGGFSCHLIDLHECYAELSKLWRKICDSDLKTARNNGTIRRLSGHRLLCCRILDRQKKVLEPFIRIVTTSAQHLDFIVRAWCRRIDEYPTALRAFAYKRTYAQECLRDQRRHEVSAWSDTVNCHMHIEKNIIFEQQYYSNPARLSYYLDGGFYRVEFGDTATIQLVDSLQNVVQFSMLVRHSANKNRVRLCQPFGTSYNTAKVGQAAKRIAEVTKRRGHFASDKAKRYYNNCVRGYFKFNPYIYYRYCKYDEALLRPPKKNTNTDEIDNENDCEY